MIGTRGQVHRPIHGEKPWEDSSPQGTNCKYLVGQEEPDPLSRYLWITFPC